MMQGIAGKVAIVTGGSSGIGRATALAFAAHGAKVVVSSRREQEGQETVKLIQAAGGEGIFIQTDVTDSADVEGLINATVETYGRLDFAFNNAGIGGEFTSTADMTEATWNKVIATNLTGVFLSMKYELRQMLKQGGGVIVNMSSVLGLIGSVNAAAYGAAKHGVIGLTKAAALEYAKLGIRVNAVCPGAIETPMMDTDFMRQPGVKEGVISLHPLGRMGVPEEVANTVVWLCSEHSSFITGQALAIDGGWSTH